MPINSSERISFIEYKGLRILYTDFTGLSAEDYLPVLDRAMELVKLEKEKSIYTLSRHSQIHISEPLKRKTEEFANVARPYSKGTATTGLTGLQRIIAKSIKRDIYFADNLEQAKEYLYKLETERK